LKSIKLGQEAKRGLPFKWVAPSDILCYAEGAYSGQEYENTDKKPDYHIEVKLF
jgi:hypothetical protein